MKYCKNCDIKYPDEKKFCKECGNKLVNFIERPKKISTVSLTSRRKIGIISGVIVIGIIALIGINFQTTMLVSTQTPSTTSTQRCYDVQEPYTIQVPYEYTYKYSVNDATFERLWNFELGDYIKGTVIISNAEDVGGTFTVNFYYKTVDGTTTKSDSEFIQSHSSATLTTIFDSQLGQDVRGSYDVNPAKETKYKEEIQYRTIQKCD